MSAKNIDVYEKITAQITAQLQKGTIPWQRTWNSSDEAPRNFKTNKPYRGINVFLLASQPYSSPYWMTFKQADECAYRAWLKRNNLKDSLTNAKKYKGSMKAPKEGETFDPAIHKGGVKRGEKSTPIIFWKILKFADASAPKGEKTVPLLRYYNVFNVEQINGLDLPVVETPEPDYCHLPEHKRGDSNCQRAQDIIDGIKNPCPVEHGGGRAYYVPSEDRMQMPLKETFITPEAYYAVRFHETVHSTGHKDRLKRPGVMRLDTFGSEQYSEEELVAEMGAAMLCGVARIEGKVIDNQAAYIQGWLKRLQNDPKLLVSAAGQAQKAADYILNTTFDTPVLKDENDSTTDTEVVLVAA